MPSDPFTPSVRDLLLVVVFQLGVCLIALAELVDATAGFDTLVGLFGRSVGAVTVLSVIGVRLLRRRVEA